MRDWARGAGCYSQAALPMPLSKPLYILVRSGQIYKLSSIKMTSDYAKKKAAKKKEAVKVKLGKDPSKVRLEKRG